MTNDKYIEKIEAMFKVPKRVANKVQIKAEKTKVGYLIFESRPKWDKDDSEWIKFDVAKISFDDKDKMWKAYWKRASGEWEFYKEHRLFSSILKCIQEDQHCVFWG